MTEMTVQQVQRANGHPLIPATMMEWSQILSRLLWDGYNEVANWERVNKHFEEMGLILQHGVTEDSSTSFVLWFEKELPFKMLFATIYTGYDDEEITVLPNLGWSENR